MLKKELFKRVKVDENMEEKSIPLKRISVRLYSGIIDQVKTNMQKSGYNKKQLSLWFNEAIEKWISVVEKMEEHEIKQMIEDNGGLNTDLNQNLQIQENHHQWLNETKRKLDDNVKDKFIPIMCHMAITYRLERGV